MYQTLPVVEPQETIMWSWYEAFNTCLKYCLFWFLLIFSFLGTFSDIIYSWDLSSSDIIYSCLRFGSLCVFLACALKIPRVASMVVNLWWVLCVPGTVLFQKKCNIIFTLRKEKMYAVIGWNLSMVIWLHVLELGFKPRTV